MACIEINAYGGKHVKGKSNRRITLKARPHNSFSATIEANIIINSFSSRCRYPQLRW